MIPSESLRFATAVANSPVVFMSSFELEIATAPIFSSTIFAFLIEAVGISDFVLKSMVWVCIF